MRKFIVETLKFAISGPTADVTSLKSTLPFRSSCSWSVLMKVPLKRSHPGPAQP